MFVSFQFEASNERWLEGKAFVLTKNRIYGRLGGYWNDWKFLVPFSSYSSKISVLEKFRRDFPFVLKYIFQGKMQFCNFVICLLQIQIKVLPNIPHIDLNDDLKERIKRVMSSRYDTTRQHLNLSKFYANEGLSSLWLWTNFLSHVGYEWTILCCVKLIIFVVLVSDFLNNDLFVPLNRQNIILAVFQVIVDSAPDLRSLDLSDNKLYSTEHFSMLKRYASNLKSLDLSKNKVPIIFLIRRNDERISYNLYMYLWFDVDTRFISVELSARINDHQT